MLTTVCYMALRTYGILTSCVCGFVSVLGAVIFSVVLYSGAIDMALSWLTPITSVCTALNIATLERECSFLKELPITPLRTGLVASLYALLTVSVFNVVASVLLAVGTIKKNRLLLLPWLITNGLLLALWTVGCIAEFIYVAVHYHASIIFLVIFFFFHAVFLVISWYLYFGIYLLFKNIQTLRKALAFGPDPKFDIEFTEISGGNTNPLCNY